MTDVGTPPFMPASERRGAGRLELVALMRRLLRATAEEELYELIGEWSVEHLDTGRTSVTRHEGEWVRVLSVSEQNGPSVYRAGDVAPLAGTAVDHVLRTGETYLWNVRDDDRGEVAASLASGGLHAIVAAPIRVHGTITGTFNVATESTDDLGADLIDATTEIADFLSVNLERLQIRNELTDELARAQANAETLGRLNDLAVDLSAVDDEDEALEIVADELSRIVPSTRVAYAVPLPDGRHVQLQHLRDHSATPPIAAGHTLPIEGSANGAVLRSGRSIFFGDLATSPYAEHRTLASGGLRSGICIPVPIGGRVGAVLNSAASEYYSIGDDRQSAVEALAALAGANVERIRAQRSADRQSERMRAVVDDSPLLIMTVGADHTVDRMSQFAAERLGHDREQWVDASVGDLYTDADRPESERRIGELMASPVGTVSAWTSKMLDANGLEISVRHTGRRLNDDEVTRDASVMLVCEDVSELKALSDQLEHQATHDPLTGLVNRREFDRRLEASVDDGSDPVSLCFIDVDRFKLVNDTAGHSAGDDLLIDIASGLSDSIDRADTLARVGGDEFALILAGCSLPDAVRVAERLRRRVGGMVASYGGRSFPVSLSIGVATYDPEQGVDTLVTDADLACYAAKSAGRNRVSVASSGAETARRRDGEWVQRVQDALTNGGLRLAAQPIAPLAPEDDRLNYEVLVRMVDGDDLIPAGVFIPPTERYGLITDVDRWVVTELLDTLAAHPSVLDRLGFCTINLSARSIENEDFLEFLLETLGTQRVAPDRLVFEITETTALSQFATAVRFIESVSALGCRFALDDFGAGFSTYQYLKQLPVHILKIDGSLVRDLATDPIDREIVHSMTQVAAAIGMETVAEFVEDATTSTLLSGLGVDYAQGWGIGKPRLIDEVVGELEATADSARHG